MNFTATDQNDLLRIMVIRPKTEIQVFEEDLKSKPSNLYN